jgi:hypothetical protein
MFIFFIFLLYISFFVKILISLFLNYLANFI